MRTNCRRHIVAHDVFLGEKSGKHLLRTQNVSERNQLFYRTDLLPCLSVCLVVSLVLHNIVEKSSK